MAQAEYVTNANRARITSANAKPTSPARGVYAELATIPPGHLPHPKLVKPGTVDLQDCAQHLNKVLSALSVYATAILDGIAQNVPGGLGLCRMEPVLSDLAIRRDRHHRARRLRQAGRVA
jgi:hypothetical protein